MSAIYDNWERLVAAVLKKQQLWELFHDDSSSPSLLSESSDFSSRLDYNFSSSSKLEPKLVLVSDFSPAFDVTKAYVVSTELLVRGTFGCVYTVTMDNEAKVVVKRLISTTVSEQDFKRNMEIVGDVKHENVVPLRAYYSSQDQKIMLYDYYRNGSVYSLLHGQTDENRAHLDWETRLKIAIGAARGLAIIHTHLGGMLVHGNVKASNVFLNQQSYGCVSDLGLTNMINTTFSQTERCYAPEVKNTQTVTHASDVYSFGILLLELLTRKSSAHVPGTPAAIDLVKLVNSVKSKDKAAKIFDAELILINPSISNEMLKMLQIGIKCVQKSIKRRPKMTEVVKMLEDIFPLKPISQVPLRENLYFVEDANPTYVLEETFPLNPVSEVSLRENLVLVENANPTFDLEDICPLNPVLVFVEDANPIFDLKDMFRASAEVLGKGTFGTSYLAILENGITIVVKRLKNVITTYKDFQLHAEILGSMRHENVVGLMAYYFSRDEKILVYDYYHKRSLSALLHGKEGASTTPLDWGVRFETAVGAARGIAHIHKHDGPKFVHGNIKSSNILANGRNYGIVSDAGLTQLIDPMQLPNVLSHAYRAPEIRMTRKVSQASDVYSFGVVLLELVSGRPSHHTTDDGEILSLVTWAQSVINNESIDQVLDIECLSNENKEAMKQMLQIAMDCINRVPEDRPIMPQVVKALKEISGSNSFESELEFLLEDLLPTLTS